MRQIITFNNKNWPLPVQPTPNYLCFTANAANSTVRLNQVGTSSLTPDFEISTDKRNWQTYTLGTTITLSNIGDKLYMRGNNTTLGHDGNNYKNFAMSGNISVSGDLRTLLSKTSPTDITTLPTRCFSLLFYNCTSLYSAADLKLEATTIGDRSYMNLFLQCSNLVYAPKEIGNATLSEYSCNQMFSNCTSLLESPILKIETIPAYAFRSMFWGCSSLNKVTSYAQNLVSNDSLNFWMYQVPETGDFYNLGGATYMRGQHGIPSGWTEHTSL